MAFGFLGFFHQFQTFYWHWLVIWVFAHPAGIFVTCWLDLDHKEFHWNATNTALFNWSRPIITQPQSPQKWHCHTTSRNNISFSIIILCVWSRFQCFEDGARSKESLVSRPAWCRRSSVTSTSCVKPPTLKTFKCSDFQVLRLSSVQTFKCYVNLSQTSHSWDFQVFRLLSVSCVETFKCF